MAQHLIWGFAMLALAYSVWCAPRPKTKSLPQTVYDQKQTGDYNIQLHLKDFQIIALLADDSLGGLGDYEYDYDYSDFTVKPSGSTTNKPNLTIEAADNSTLKPTNHPYPIVLPSTTEKPILESKPPVVNIEEKPGPLLSSTTAKVSTSTISTPVDQNSPGKIKVQILETPVAPPVGIVPGEDFGEGHEPGPLGDTPLRRCSTGFSRDKKGRCRRVRRPGPPGHQLPFGIGRLATNLASRLRYAPAEDSSVNID